MADEKSTDWVTVPRDPTLAMVEAFHVDEGEGAFSKWDAMVAAAPPAPPQPNADGIGPITPEGLAFCESQAQGSGVAVAMPVVAWSLAWPMDVSNGTVNAMTTFGTQAEANRYARDCMVPDRFNANPPPVVSVGLVRQSDAQAIIDRLTRERDEAREHLREMTEGRDHWESRWKGARAELSALRAMEAGKDGEGLTKPPRLRPMPIQEDLDDDGDNYEIDGMCE